MRKLLVHQHRRARALLGGAVLAVLLTTLVAPPPTLGAQTTTPSPSPRPVVIWHDVRLLGAFTLASVVVMPADRGMQRVLQRDWMQQSHLLSSTADVFNAYGSPGVFAGSAVLYAAGWASGRADVSRLGLRAGEAIILSSIVTSGLKGIAGRARPFTSPQEPGNWSFLGGMHDAARQSFPSGHTTAVFAFATAMDYELRASNPSVARWASPALYGAAALTGLARLHADKHWLSDVVMGAGIGVVSGLIVSRFHADRPKSWIDGHLLPHAH